MKIGLGDYSSVIIVEYFRHLVVTALDRQRW